MGCWELVRLLYRRCFAIELPDRAHIVNELDEWSIVSRGAERFGDVLVFRETVGKHVGFCLDEQRMIHTTSTKDNVIERYIGTAWKDRLQSIYRHKTLA